MFQRQKALQRPNLLVAALAVGYGTTVLFVVIPSLIASLLFHGGALIKLPGIVFVRRDGRPASRWRVVAQNLVGWLPFLLLTLAVNTGIALPVLGGFCVALVAVSVLMPERGLQNGIVGTWLVPR